MSLPKIRNVKESLVGVIGGSEFINLITDQDGKIIKNLFYDNVRDYLGNNPVNVDISHSLESMHEKDLFTVLNNGITLVAKDAKLSSGIFHIKDYQIVNGCQTSHVLYKNRDKIDNDLSVSIKVIVTDNQEITNRVIKATNWQTTITEEAFESLNEFHKELEEYFDALNIGYSDDIFYERRSKQYVGSSTINHYQIISMPLLINSFVSMFLSTPQSTHRYYGNILNQHKKEIFQSNHNKIVYYTSAKALNKFEKKFKESNSKMVYRRFKYHFLYGLKLLVFGERDLRFNSNKITKKCKEVLNFIDKDDLLDKIFQLLCTITDKTIDDVDMEKRDYTRTRVFTNAIKNNALQEHKKIHIIN